jgi:DNA uptake protein ComE-like DNA-binding protein
MRFSFILVAVMSVAIGFQVPVVAAKSVAAVENVSKAELLDINTATVEQLRALPGMGDVYVRRIVAGRPYGAKNQLVTRGVITQQAYERIQSRIVARRPQK